MTTTTDLLTAGSEFTSDGVTFKYVTADPTGSGVFDTFLQIDSKANSTTETGYNTGAPQNSLPLDDGQQTSAVLLSTIVPVNIDGVDYYAIGLDVNEPNATHNSNATDIYLDSFKVYQTSSGTPSLSDLNSSTPVYDLGDNSLHMSDHASGSGAGDYVIYIPASKFTGDGKYFTLYAAFHDATGGFEEFGVTTAAPPGPGPDPQHGAIQIDKVTMVGDTVVEGQNILASDDVTWQYTVTNDATLGNQALSNVTVTDDNGTASTSDDWQATYVSGDDGNGLLDVGETWIFTASASAHGGTQAGTYQNTGTATGQWTGTDSVVHTPTDDDSSNYFGVTLGVDVKKEVSVDGGNTWSDANTATGPTLLNVVGSQAPQYKITVTNTSNLAQTVNLSDLLDGNSYNLGANSSATLAANGGSTSFVINGTWAAGQHTNTVTATESFTDAAGQSDSVSDSDSANYYGVKLGVSLEKQVVDNHGTAYNADTAATGPSLLAGSADHWAFVLTNTSNIAQTVNLSDLGLSYNDSVTLAAGGSTTLTHALTWAAGQQQNNAKATIDYTDSAGNHGTACDYDPAFYFGADAKLSIAKVTTTAHHGSGDGINVIAGESIGWQYTVKNAGNVALSGVTVSDDNGTAGTGDDFSAAYASGDNGNGVLDVGETWIFKASGTAASGSYSNTGTATGHYVDTAGNHADPSAQDGSSYFGLGLATPGLSKGYWANHSFSPAIGSTANKLVIGDSDMHNDANDNYDLTFGLSVAQTLLNNSATGDARIIMGGQLVAAQLNADKAHVSVNGLLEQGAKWFFTNGGQDSGSNTGSDGTHTATGDTVTQNEWANKFTDGASVSTNGAAWNSANFYLHTGVASLTGEGLKNMLMAYDHGVSGTTDGLVVSTDGSLVGWQHGSAVTHVYTNTFDNAIAVVNDANAAGQELAAVGVHLAGISHA